MRAEDRRNPYLLVRGRPPARRHLCVHWRGRWLCLWGEDRRLAHLLGPQLRRFKRWASLGHLCLRQRRLRHGVRRDDGSLSGMLADLDQSADQSYLRWCTHDVPPASRASGSHRHDRLVYEAPAPPSLATPANLRPVPPAAALDGPAARAEYLPGPPTPLPQAVRIPSTPAPGRPSLHAVTAEPVLARRRPSGRTVLALAAIAFFCITASVIVFIAWSGPPPSAAVASAAAPLVRDERGPAIAAPPATEEVRKPLEPPPPRTDPEPAAEVVGGQHDGLRSNRSRGPAARHRLHSTKASVARRTNDASVGAPSGAGHMDETPPRLIPWP
jgi:hypothetical protein